jgi:hypothetical protein
MQSIFETVGKREFYWEIRVSFAYCIPIGLLIEDDVPAQYQRRKSLRLSYVQLEL